MTTRILVPLDITHAARRALAVGATLADQIDARLEVVVVRGPFPSVDPKEAWGLAGSVNCRLDDVDVIESQWAEQALSNLVRDPDTLLCVASHGRSAVGELILGSVSAGVVRRAEAPLLLVGPNGPERPPESFRNLVVGIDGDGPDSMRVLPEVARWAATGLRPWLVQVVSNRALARAPGDVVETVAVRHVASSLRDAGVRAEWDVLHCESSDSRHVAEAMVRFGDDLGDTIGLMATHGRTGLAHLTLGSVALDVVHHASWPVLIVPPNTRVDVHDLVARAAQR